MISAFHGIGAYKGQKNPVALSRQLTTALNIDGEICVADRPIGAFGVVFGGEMNALFSGDCWSKINDNGMRESEASADIENLDNQIEFETFCKNRLYELREYRNSDRIYSEGWMVTQALRAVWVKDWADERTIKASMIIAKNRRVPFIVVKGTTRIWDVLDFYNLPVAI
jgi:hypothetical protein